MKMQRQSLELGNHKSLDSNDPKFYENAKMHVNFKFFQKIKSMAQNVPPSPFICSIKLKNQIHTARVVALYIVTIFVASRCTMEFAHPWKIFGYFWLE